MSWHGGVSLCICKDGFIPYETAAFSNLKYNSGSAYIRKRSPNGAKVTCHATQLTTDWTELLLHAATVGDYAVPLG